MMTDAAPMQIAHSASCPVPRARTRQARPGRGPDLGAGRGLRLYPHRFGDVLLVRVVGALDAAALVDLAAAIEGAIPAPTGLVIDMREVIAVSAAAAGGLMSVERRMRQRGGHLCVAAIPDSRDALLAVSAVGPVPVFAHADAALLWLTCRSRP